MKNKITISKSKYPPANRVDIYCYYYQQLCLKIISAILTIVRIPFCKPFLAMPIIGLFPYFHNNGIPPIKTKEYHNTYHPFKHCIAKPKNPEKQEI